MWTGESGYFRIRWRSKIVSSLLPNNKPIWRHNVQSKESKFPATIARSIYGACSEDILVQRSPGYQSESGNRMRVDGRISFEYATCGRANFNTSRVDGEIFESGKKKFADTCGRDLRKPHKKIQNSTFHHGQFCYSTSPFLSTSASNSENKRYSFWEPRSP